MRFVTIFVILALTGCNGPGLDFVDVPAKRVVVQGSVFDVRVKGRAAEAIRITPQYAPRLGPIGARAAFAMQVVSGCDVTRIKGDAAVIRGDLRCAGQPARAAPGIGSGGSLDCYAIDSFKSAATGQLITSYDCDWVPD